MARHNHINNNKWLISLPLHEFSIAQLRELQSTATGWSTKVKIFTGISNYGKIPLTYGKEFCHYMWFAELPIYWGISKLRAWLRNLLSKNIKA